MPELSLNGDYIFQTPNIKYLSDGHIFIDLNAILLEFQISVMYDFFTCISSTCQLIEIAFINISWELKLY